MDIIETFDIDAPAATVWSVISDVERWPSWTRSIDEVTITSASPGTPPGPLALGSTAQVKQPRFPRLTWTVSDFQDGRSFTWEAASGGVRTSAVHTVEPIGPDRCRATLTIHQRGPLDRVVALFAGKRSRRYVAMEAEGLTRRSEELAAAS